MERPGLRLGVRPGLFGGGMVMEELGELAWGGVLGEDGGLVVAVEAFVEEGDAAELAEGVDGESELEVLVGADGAYSGRSGAGVAWAASWAWGCPLRRASRVLRSSCRRSLPRRVRGRGSGQTVILGMRL